MIFVKTYAAVDEPNERQLKWKSFPSKKNFKNFLGLSEIGIRKK